MDCFSLRSSWNSTKLHRAKTHSFKDGIDLQSLSEHEKTVITVTFEHRNDNLIKYLLKHHKILVKNKNPIPIEDVTNNNKYEKMLHTALQKVNS